MKQLRDAPPEANSVSSSAALLLTAPVQPSGLTPEASGSTPPYIDRRKRVIAAVMFALRSTKGERNEGNTKENGTYIYMGTNWVRGGGHGQPNTQEINPRNRPYRLQLHITQ